MNPKFARCPSCGKMSFENMGLCWIRKLSSYEEQLLFRYECPCGYEETHEDPLEEDYYA